MTTKLCFKYLHIPRLSGPLPRYTSLSKSTAGVLNLMWRPSQPSLLQVLFWSSLFHGRGRWWLNCWLFTSYLVAQQLQMLLQSPLPTCMNARDTDSDLQLYPASGGPFICFSRMMFCYAYRMNYDSFCWLQHILLLCITAAQEEWRGFSWNAMHCNWLMGGGACWSL